MADQITLYHSPFSRSMTAYWLLEELAVSFEVVIKDISKGQQKEADLLALNPSGKVPTVVVGDTVLTERPAICIYLADRYSYGDLAPKIEDPLRAEYLKWIVYSVTVMESAMIMHEEKLHLAPSHAGWGSYETMLDVVENALSASEFLISDEFTTADIMFGSTLGWALASGMMPKRDAYTAYSERIERRPAFQAALAATYQA